MMRPWGRLLAAASASLSPLIAPGCAVPAPPPAAAASPGPPARVSSPRGGRAEAQEPPGAARGLGDFAPLPLLGDGTLPVSAQPGSTASFGGGVMQLVFFRDAGGGCLLPTPSPGRCSFLAFAPWSRAPEGGSFRFAAAEVGGWARLEPAAADWVAIFPGRDRVYALRSGEGVRIDAVDENGVRSVVSADAVPGYERFVARRVVETSRGLVVVGAGAGRGKRDAVLDADLAVVSLEFAPGGQARVAGVTRLEKVEASDAATAEEAREWQAGGRHAVLEDYEAAPLLDEKGAPGPDWVLAMNETVVWPRSGRRPDGCSAPPSRHLRDPSLPHSLQMLRLSHAGRVLARRALRQGQPEAPRLSPWPGGVVLGGARYAASLGAELRGPPPGASALPPPTARTQPDQEFCRLAFDEASGEGALLVVEGERQVLRRFDPLGLAQGEPAVLDPPLEKIGRAEIARMPRPVDGWVAADGPGAVVVLTGPLAARRVAIPPGPAPFADLPAPGPGGTLVSDDQPASLWLIPGDGGRLVLVGSSRGSSGQVNAVYGVPGDGPTLEQSVVDVAAGTASPFALDPAWYLPDERGQSRLVDIAAIVRAADGGALLLGHDRAHGRLSAIARGPSGSFDAPSRRLEPSASFFRLVPVYGDTVLARRDRQDTTGGAQLTWLAAGQTLEAPLLGLDEHSGRTSPGVDPSLPLLASTPGPPLPPAAWPGEIAQSCKAQVATGDRRLVIACVEGVGGAKRPRVGLRVLRY